MTYGNTNTGLGWEWGSGGTQITPPNSYLYTQFQQNNPANQWGKPSAPISTVTPYAPSGQTPQSPSNEVAVDPGPGGGIFGMDNMTLLLIGGAILLVIYFLKK